MTTVGRWPRAPAGPTTPTSRGAPTTTSGSTASPPPAPTSTARPTCVAALRPGRRVLDAGCGTGRVAIELARRGFDVVGVDLDPRHAGPGPRQGPGAALDPGRPGHLAPRRGRFDAVVLAGNVLIFVAPGTEADVVARCAAHLRPGGLLVAGFQVRAGGYGPDALDRRRRGRRPRAGATAGRPGTGSPGPPAATTRSPSTADLTPPTPVGAVGPLGAGAQADLGGRGKKALVRATYSA